MKRYLVLDWYLHSQGEPVLMSERLFKTELDATLYAIRLKRKLNEFHSVDVVCMVQESYFLGGKK